MRTEQLTDGLSELPPPSAGACVPTLFGVSLICFFLTYMLPGNPAMVKAGPFATPEHLAEMERPRWGSTSRCRMQYVRYVTGLFHGDLGESSSTGRPVLQDFMQRLPATLELDSREPADRSRC